MTHPPEQGQTLDDRLATLLEKARKHVMTPLEIYEQRVSWIYGELGLQGREVTREYVEQVLLNNGISKPADDLKAIDEAVVPEPVAWYRMEEFRGESMRVYYEGNPWPDMTPLYGPEVLAYAQQSAEAARVAREELSRAEIIHTHAVKALGDALTAAESRLREVEARTVERCATACNYLLEDEVVSKHVDSRACIAARIAIHKCVNAIRALPSSTDTEEK